MTPRLSPCSSTEALMREIDSATMLARPLLHIRVTTDALRGSPAAVPITPERARRVRLRAFEGRDGEAVVDGDPEVYLRSLEIVVHPADWADVLAELPDRYVGDRIRMHQDARTGARVEFMGIEVQT